MTSADLVVGLLAAAVGGCSRPAASGASRLGDGRLTVSGSSTVAPLVGEIAKRFEAVHPGVRIDVQTGGSSRGVADARRGTVQIGMVSPGARPHGDGPDGYAHRHGRHRDDRARDQPRAWRGGEHLTYAYVGIR